MSEIQQKLVEAIELQTQGEIVRACELFKFVLTKDPANPAAFYSLGLMAKQMGQRDQALQWATQGVVASPYFAQLRFLLATVLQDQGDFDNALKQYDAALVLQPDYQEVLLNSGALLRTLHRHKEALERFNKILMINPAHQGSLANAGVLLAEFKQGAMAVKMFERLLELNPEYEYAQGLLFYEKLLMCDWTGYHESIASIKKGINEGRPVCKSLAFMSVSDQAEEHFKATQLFSARYCPPSEVKLWQGEKYKHDRIRLAYISPDFREHPVCHLIAGVIENHDKSRFELFAVSLGIDDGSRLRSRMLSAFEHFLDARQLTSEQIAVWMRKHEIDIAVDLGGYTADTRTQILSFRPAPVQVNYLGYPGSMGVDYIDYILADRYVIPLDQMKYYQERVVYVPGTYLPFDTSIEISPQTPSRYECGLPETGFVFCSFSHDYKLTPDLFDVWMRLLQNAPGSVLWLASKGEIARANLRREAEARGLSADRLVFAGRVPRVEDHLARYRLANLFLDTYPYNAHTTAADALMAGLPVLTLKGRSFPSRVASGVVESAGLGQFCAESLEQYESIAMDCVKNYNSNSQYKKIMITPQTKSSLQFARELELVFSVFVRQTMMDPLSDELIGGKKS
jgi:predicted O-linked N-acetylglucosamine transferase (SPINDLY family)